MGLFTKEPEDYFDPCYNKETILRSYEPAINPINGPNNWPKTVRVIVIPPQNLKLPGRPKIRRRKELGEGRKKAVIDHQPKKLSKKEVILKRKSCKKTGHNARKCPTSQPQQ